MKKLFYCLAFLGILSTNTGGSSLARRAAQPTGPESMNAEIDNASVKMTNLKYRLEQMAISIKEAE